MIVETMKEEENEYWLTDTHLKTKKALMCLLHDIYLHQFIYGDDQVYVPALFSKIEDNYIYKMTTKIFWSSVMNDYIVINKQGDGSCWIKNNANNINKIMDIIYP